MKQKLHILTVLRLASAALAVSIMGASVGFAQMSGSPDTPDTTPSDNPKHTNKQYNRSGNDSNEANVKYSDRHFIERAAKMNTEEVEVSQVVSQKGANPQVREFATEMVTAHEKVGSALATLAANKGLTLDHQKDNAKKWMEKKPNELDEDYVKRMESAHKTLIDLFEKAAKSSDADVAQFANTYLPDLRMHYSKAEGLKGQVKS